MAAAAAVGPFAANLIVAAETCHTIAVTQMAVVPRHLRLIALADRRCLIMILIVLVVGLHRLVAAEWVPHKCQTAAVEA